MKPELLKGLKQELEKRKERLEKELASFAQKDPRVKGDYDTVFPDFEPQSPDENALEVETYGNALPVEYALEKKLADINEALDRIKKGTYGICANCNEEIDEKRLKAMPEAKTCIKCNHGK